MRKHLTALPLERNPGDDQPRVIPADARSAHGVPPFPDGRERAGIAAGPSASISSADRRDHAAETARATSCRWRTPMA